jgi:hypothetical protein
VGRRFNDDFSGTGSKHIEPFRSRPGYVKYPGTDKRPPVIDPDGNFFTVFGIGHDEIGAKRQIGMGRRKLSRIENLSGSGSAARKLGPVPRSDTFLAEIARRGYNRVTRRRGRTGLFSLH